ncbi:hypothetical protein [Halosimplex sp. J119]
MQELADRTRVTAAVGYYKAANTRFVSAPASRIGTKVTRRVVSRVDVDAPDRLRKTLSGAGTVGRSWSLSRRVGNTPSGVLRGLSERGRTQLRAYYRRIRGSGGSGDDTGLEALTDGGQKAALLQRELGETDFGAVFNAELPDETRAALLRASDDGDLSASETATVARKLDEPGNADVVSTIRALDETEQRRAFELIGQTGNDGVELIRDLDSTATENLLEISSGEALRENVARLYRDGGVGTGEIEEFAEYGTKFQDTSGVDEVFRDVTEADAGGNFRGAKNELKPADQLEEAGRDVVEFERDITTSVGSTDIDVITRNDDLVESKSDFSSVSSGDTKYNQLAQKITVLKKYQGENGLSGDIEVHFETVPTDDVKNLLDRKDIDCSVRTENGLSPC